MTVMYYEFNQLDYYALVRADSPSDAARCYIENVAYGQEDYEEVLEAADQISEAVAFEKIKESFKRELKTEDAQELHALFEIDFKAQSLMQEALQVLLIDGSLL